VKFIYLSVEIFLDKCLKDFMFGSLFKTKEKTKA